MSGCRCDAPGEGDPCGCVDAALPPEPIHNAPGLPSIRYRVGTYASFREAMIRRAGGRPELAGWTTREDDDPAVTLLDLWAYVGDVLTFYQERYANEAYLRTAVHHESVLRIAALLGYRPAPGAAAEAVLAFTLDKGKTALVPAGTRVQSVPAKDEKPQKFETSEPLHADARLNRVRAHGAPVLESAGPSALAAGSSSGRLAPDAARRLGPLLRKDARLLLLRGTSPVEEKTLESVETDERGARARWRPSNVAAGTAMLLVRRSYALFGAGVPAQTVAPVVVEGRLTWQTKTATFAVAQNARSVDLEGAQDVKPGARVVLAYPEGALDTTVESVSKATRTDLGMNLPVTRVTLAAGLPVAMSDSREATLHEVEPLPVRFATKILPDGPIRSGAREVRLLARDLGIPAGDLARTLPRGRLLLLDDDKRRPHVARILEVADEPAPTLAPAGSGEAAEELGEDTVRIRFDPPLGRDLDADAAVLLGNVAEATHGETVAGEVLGNGDASTPFQSFTLRKKPLTHVASPGARGGVVPTLRVRVDGVLWKEAADLHAAGDARAYALDADETGEVRIRFGDGRHGARLPSGRDNVTATYRHGIGRAGNVAADALRNLVDRPPGVKGVTNPGPSEGGVDPETMDQARENAPNAVRTFGRIVSLRDFEDAAREFPGVRKARAGWSWVREERAVRLVVAGDPAAPFLEEKRKDLKKDLDARRDPNRPLDVVLAEAVPIRISLDVEVHPDHEPERVAAAVREALVRALAFDRVQLGEPVNLSDVYRAAQEAEGVVAVRIKRLARLGDAFAALARRLRRIRLRRGLFGQGLAAFALDARDDAVPRSLRLEPDEIAVLADPSRDVVVTPVPHLVPPEATQ